MRGTYTKKRVVCFKLFCARWMPGYTLRPALHGRRNTEQDVNCGHGLHRRGCFFCILDFSWNCVLLGIRARWPQVEAAGHSGRGHCRRAVGIKRSPKYKLRLTKKTRAPQVTTPLSYVSHALTYSCAQGSKLLYCTLSGMWTKSWMCEREISHLYCTGITFSWCGPFPSSKKSRKRISLRRERAPRPAMRTSYKYKQSFWKLVLLHVFNKKPILFPFESKKNRFHRLLQPTISANWANISALLNWLKFSANCAERIYWQNECKLSAIKADI